MRYPRSPRKAAWEAGEWPDSLCALELMSDDYRVNFLYATPTSILV